MFYVKKFKVLLRFFVSFFIGLLKIDIRNNFLIFNYHIFNTNNKINDSMFVSFDNFSLQMEYFKNNSNILTPNELLKKEFKKKITNIFITIDDGDISLINLKNIYNFKKTPITLCLPIGLMLDKNNIDYYRSLCLHHFFFINQNSVNEIKEKFFNEIFNYDIFKLKILEKKLKKKNINTDYVLRRPKLTINKIYQLSNSENISICSHSMSHVFLSQLPSNWLDWEISKSLSYIKSLNGLDFLFSLPYGNFNSFDKNVFNCCKKHNIKIILTSLNIKNKYQKNLLGRTYVLNSSNTSYLRGLLSKSMYFFDKFFKKI